jgi:hypothetical protein
MVTGPLSSFVNDLGDAPRITRAWHICTKTAELPRKLCTSHMPFLP